MFGLLYFDLILGAAGCLLVDLCCLLYALLSVYCCLFSRLVNSVVIVVLVFVIVVYEFVSLFGWLLC